MVDSIRQSGRVGVIRAPGPLRTVKRRAQSRQESDENQEEQTAADDHDRSQGLPEHGNRPEAEDGPIKPNPTGNRIDLII